MKPGHDTDMKVVNADQYFYLAAAGEEGLVDEAQKAMEEAEALKKVTAGCHSPHLTV